MIKAIINVNLELCLAWPQSSHPHHSLFLPGLERCHFCQSLLQTGILLLDGGLEPSAFVSVQAQLLLRRVQLRSQDETIEELHTSSLLRPGQGPVSTGSRPRCHLRATEALTANGDDVAIRKLVCLLLVRALGCSLV